MNKDIIPEEEPCFYFEANISGMIKGYVYANSKDEAIEQIKNMDIDDKIINNLNIEDITKIHKDQ